MKILFGKLYFILMILYILLSVPNIYAVEKSGELFFTNIFSPTFSDGFIDHLNIRENRVDTLVSTGGGARGIAVDFYEGKIYWSDKYRGVITRASFDGTNQEDIVTTGLSYPEGVVIDIEHGKIYWVDSNHIGCSNLDGGEQTVLIAAPCILSGNRTRCSTGAGLALDPMEGKLYWTSPHSLGMLGDILMADLDGSNIEIVVNAVGNPSSIQIDPIGEKIYWTDHVDDVVRRSKLDGTEIEDLFIVGKNNNPHGLALDLESGYVYWSQDGDQTDRSCLKRMNLDGTQPEDVTCGLGVLSDIEFVSKATNKPPEHFTCYKARPEDWQRLKLKSLEDQFIYKEGVRLIGPVEICAPADKNQEGVENWKHHLVCYYVRGSKERVNQLVEVKNQFGTQTLRVKGKTRRLCVPSIKRVID